MSIATALWVALDAAALDSTAWVNGKDVFIDVYNDRTNHRSIQGALKASMGAASEGDTDRFSAGMDAFWGERKIPSTISLKLIWGIVGLIVGLVLAVILSDIGLIKGIAPGLALVGLIAGVSFAFSFIGDRFEKRAITELETH